MWISLWGSDQVARITADGEVSTIDLIENGEPHGLAIARDGALWVALESGSLWRLPVG